MRFQFLLHKYCHGCSVPHTIPGIFIWFSCLNAALYDAMVLTQVVHSALRTTYSYKQFKSSSTYQLIRQLNLFCVDRYCHSTALALF